MGSKDCEQKLQQPAEQSATTVKYSVCLEQTNKDGESKENTTVNAVKEILFFLIKCLYYSTIFAFLPILIYYILDFVNGKSCLVLIPIGLIGLIIVILLILPCRLKKQKIKMNTLTVSDLTALFSAYIAFIALVVSFIFGIHSL